MSRRPVSRVLLSRGLLSRGLLSRGLWPVACSLVAAATLLATGTAAVARGEAVGRSYTPADQAGDLEDDVPNRLNNPDFETGGKRPDHWSRGQPVPGVEHAYSRRDGVDKSRALSLNKTVERYFPIAEWCQEFAHEGKSTKLHVGALVRAEHAYKATVDVRFSGDDGETHAWAVYIGARESGDAPAEHEWRWYSGVVQVPPGTETIGIALQIYGPGKVWFDRVLARYVDEETAVTDAARTPSEPTLSYGALPAGSASQEGSAPPGGDRQQSDGESWSRPCADLRLDDDEKKRYFLIGPPQGARGPFGLLLVVPGGDGSADFNGFVRRIAENAVPKDMIVAQAVAPVWTEDADRIVWPTTTNKDPRMEFATEEFLSQIIIDAAKRHRLDKKRIFTLGWSSGGPPCYALSLRKKTPVRGTFVVMSVFQPGSLPSLKAAKGHPYYLLHSPEDFIAMSHPELAKSELTRRKAKVFLQTYEGGHGWHGDVYGNIRRGVEWLEDAR